MGLVHRAKKRFLRMWFRSLRLHGRRLRACNREGGHLCASVSREPRAVCAHAAGCRDPHLRSAHPQPAGHLASNRSRRLARSLASQVALPEPSRSFAGGHAMPTMRPHVHQPYGRFSICQAFCDCLSTGPSGSQTWTTRNGPGRVQFRRPASDLLTSSSLVVTRRSAQWRSKPRRPFLARVLAPLTSLMPVRTPRQLILGPQPWQMGVASVLLVRAMAARCGWMTADARAAPRGLAADERKRKGGARSRGPQRRPTIGRPSRIDARMAALPSWPLRAARSAQHGHLTLWRQACSRRALR